MEVPWTLSNPTPPPTPHHLSPQPPPPPPKKKKKTVCNLVAGCGGACGGRMVGGWGGGKGGFCKQTIAYHPQYNGEACGCSVHVHLHVGLCTRRFVHNPMRLSQRHHFKGFDLA